MTSAAPWTRPTVAWALDRHPYHSTAPDTGTLVSLLLEEPVWLIVTTTAQPEQEHLVDRILTHASPITGAVLREIRDALVKAWTGWPGWTATRIWRETLETWQHIDGTALTAGVDILALPSDRATTTAFTLLSQRHTRDKDHGDRWLRTLQAEPLDVTRREAERRDDAQAAADFRAMQSIFGGLGR